MCYRFPITVLLGLTLWVDPGQRARRRCGISIAVVRASIARMRCSSLVSTLFMDSRMRGVSRPVLAGHPFHQHTDGRGTYRYQ